MASRDILDIITRTALRGNQLRVDLHVSVPGQAEIADPQFIKSAVNSFLIAATQRGLDIVGIISDWLLPGKIARQLAQEEGIDIFVLPGQEVVTSEGLGILALNIETEIPQRLPLNDCLHQIKAQNGMAVTMRPSKRWMQRLNKMLKEPWCPAGIEVYSPKLPDFRDLENEPEFALFMTAGAKTPKELLNSNINTITDREWWVNQGVLTHETGVNYEPAWLTRGDHQYGTQGLQY